MFNRNKNTYILEIEIELHLRFSDDFYVKELEILSLNKNYGAQIALSELKISGKSPKRIDGRYLNLVKLDLSDAVDYITHNIVFNPLLYLVLPSQFAGHISDFFLETMFVKNILIHNPEQIPKLEKAYNYDSTVSLRGATIYTTFPCNSTVIPTIHYKGTIESFGTDLKIDSVAISKLALIGIRLDQTDLVGALTVEEQVKTLSLLNNNVMKDYEFKLDTTRYAGEHNRGIIKFSSNIDASYKKFIVLSNAITSKAFNDYRVDISYVNKLIKLGTSNRIIAKMMFNGTTYLIVSRYTDNAFLEYVVSIETAEGNVLYAIKCVDFNDYRLTKDDVFDFKHYFSNLIKPGDHIPFARYTSFEDIACSSFSLPYYVINNTIITPSFTKPVADIINKSILSAYFYIKERDRYIAIFVDILTGEHYFQLVSPRFYGLEDKVSRRLYKGR